MSIKTKISLALAFLFTVILGLVLVGTHYLHQLAHDAQEIIKDNYRTLSYVTNMSSALHRLEAAYAPDNDTLLTRSEADYHQSRSLYLSTPCVAAGLTLSSG